MAFTSSIAIDKKSQNLTSSFSIDCQYHRLNTPGVYKILYRSIIFKAHIFTPSTSPTGQLVWLCWGEGGVGGWRNSRGFDIFKINRRVRIAFHKARSTMEVHLNIPTNMAYWFLGIPTFKSIQCLWKTIAQSRKMLTWPSVVEITKIP